MAAVLVLAAAAVPAPDASPALQEMKVSRQGDQCVVSFTLVGGPSASMLEEIEAGIETSVNYRVQLHHRRPGLPDELLARRTVVTSARYDALTRQYTLTRRLDGDLTETRVSSDAAEMRAFLTTLSGVPVARAADLQTGETYYVRARGELGLVWRFYLIPWRQNTDWARVDIAAPVEAARDGGS